MPPEPILSIPLPKPIQGFQPSTFLERGIVVPFTTPYLQGARLRPRERRGVELVVQNPAGGRGVYIMPWDGVQALCSPTVHDRMLSDKFAQLPAVRPSALRRAAIEVAAEGVAGREALSAARACLQRDDNDRLFANVELLVDAIRTAEQQGADWAPPDLADRAALERRSRRALALLAPAVGVGADHLLTVLEDIATVFYGIGIGRQTRTARLPGLVAGLDDLQREMAAWKRTGGEAAVADATLVEATAGRTATLARATLREAWALLDDLPALARRWLQDRTAVAQLASRPEWLLDGWEQICLLWRTAEQGLGRAVTLREIVDLVPTTPREAYDWPDIAAGPASEMLTHRRKVVLGEDWRTGVTVHDLIARNERLRALSPGGPA